MDSSTPTAEDDVTSSTHFIPRRRPPTQHSTSNSNFRRSSSRPHSIGAMIISNPKLVKDWQYYDSSLNQRDNTKYFSTVQLGTSTGETFLEHQQPESNSEEDAVGTTGITGTLKSESGDDGDPNSLFLYNSRVEAYEEDARHDMGVEIKARVAEDKKLDCRAAVSRAWSPIVGIFLTLVASSVLALSSTFMESLSPDNYHPYSVLVWTSQGLFWFSFVLLLCPCQMRSINLTKPGVPTSRTNNKLVTILLIFSRAIFGWTAALLSLGSLQCVSENTSTLIIWSSPIFVLLMAWILLGEKPGWIPLIAAIVVILGVGVIVRPSLLTGKKAVEDESLFVGCLLAAGAMISEGILAAIILRHIRHVHSALITFVYGLLGMLGGLFLYFVHNNKFKLPSGGSDTWLAVTLCVLVFLGQTGINGALKYEQTGIFAATRCWQIPMLVFWRYWFLEKNPDWLSFIGSLLILSGIFILIARKLVYSLSTSSGRTRRLMGFLLI